MRFSLIGPGRVGLAMASALIHGGYRLEAVVARSQPSAQQAAKLLNGRAVGNIEETAGDVDLILIATPDDVIAQVAEKLATAGPFRRQLLVCHTSGSRSLEVLAAVSAAGALVGSIHPLQTFAQRWPAAPVAGCLMAVEAGAGALDRCLQLVQVMKGQPLQLKPGTKAFYHAAASMASNHLLGLLDQALWLLQQAGLSRKQGLEALLPLVERTLQNSRQGLEAALTGPIERGDVGTVRQHLQALNRLTGGDGRDDGAEDPPHRPVTAGLTESVYRSLGQATLELARRKHRLDGTTSEVTDAYNDLERLLTGSVLPGGDEP